MNPDQQTEQQVEDWLDAEARPMPPHVLESALEAVTRTTQVGRRGRFGVPWLNQRFLAVGMAAAVLVLAVFAAPFIAENLGGLFGPQPGDVPDGSPGEAQVWDPAADFRDSPNQLNPSPDRYGNPDVWSYLRSMTTIHNPDAYFRLPNFQVTEAGADQWYERDLINLFVAHPMGSPSLSVHPWSDGDRANDHNAIVGWTSPSSGWFMVSAKARVEATDCADPADGITFTIDQNAAVLRATSVPLGQARTLEVATQLEAGDALYFVVTPGADAHCDTTALTITITAPNPSE